MLSSAQLFSPCHLTCACALMRIFGQLMASISFYSLSLSLLSTHLKKTDSFTGARAVNRPWNELPLKPLFRLGPMVSWEKRLTIPSLIKGDLWDKWKCVLQGIFEVVLSIRRPSLTVNPFNRVNWPLQFITADICHTWALRDSQRNNITATPCNWSQNTLYTAVAACRVY